MSFRTLEIDRQGALAYLWLNRPEIHNAFDDILIEEFTSALRALEEDSQVRALVIGGRGRNFCAGADLKWMGRAAHLTNEQNLQDARNLAELLLALDRFPKPTVARVHGAALGGGMGLVAACDLAVASRDATFGTTEVRCGLVPATIGPYVLAAIGARAARRYFLTAERLPADEAHRIGLVHELCEPGLLDARIEAAVQALLAGGPMAQAAAKRFIRTLETSPAEGRTVKFTAKLIADLRATPEAREGIAAFLEKRPPRWPETARGSS